MTNTVPRSLGRAGLTLLLAFGAIAPALAQDKPPRRVMIGAGVQTVPTYPGADSNSLAFLPLFDSWREGGPMPVESPDEAFGFALLGKRSGWAAGPAVSIAPTRSADALPALGPGLPKVGFGIEAGGFVETYVVPSLRLRAELRQGIGGHRALLGDLAADFVWRQGNEGAILTVGPRLRWGSAKHNRVYFGVPSPSPIAAFAPYEPGDGIYALGAIAGMRLPLGRSFGLYGYLGYDRLTGPAKASPIVRVGSRDQYSAGLALTYRFTL